MAVFAETKVIIFITRDSAGSQVLYNYIGSSDKTIKRYPGLLHEIFNEPEHFQVIANLEDWLESHL
jgi:acylglycerol lipase